MKPGFQKNCGGGNILILDLFDRKHVPTDPFQGDKKMSGELPRALTLVSNFFCFNSF